jgi:hypothetical protein
MQLETKIQRQRQVYRKTHTHTPQLRAHHTYTQIHAYLYMYIYKETSTGTATDTDTNPHPQTQTLTRRFGEQPLTHIYIHKETSTGTDTDTHTNPHPQIRRAASERSSMVPVDNARMLLSRRFAREEAGTEVLLRVFPFFFDAPRTPPAVERPLSSLNVDSFDSSHIEPTPILLTGDRLVRIFEFFLAIVCNKGS